jgi:hypothetical protein
MNTSRHMYAQPLAHFCCRQRAVSTATVVSSQSSVAIHDEACFRKLIFRPRVQLNEQSATPTVSTPTVQQDLGPTRRSNKDTARQQTYRQHPKHLLPSTRRNGHSCQAQAQLHASTGVVIGLRATVSNLCRQAQTLQPCDQFRCGLQNMA